VLFNGFFAFFINDSTRNFSSISWGVLAATLFYAYRLASEKGEQYRMEVLQACAAAGIASLFIPRYYTWNGFIYCSSFYDSILTIRKFLIY
jgi:hypothetical protein